MTVPKASNLLSLIFLLLYLSSSGQKVWMPLGKEININTKTSSFSSWSVSLSENGKLLAIGYIYKNLRSETVGEVRIYQWTGSEWRQQGQELLHAQKELASRLCVSLNAKGNRLAIGITVDDIKTKETGKVKIFEWDGLHYRQLGNNIEGEFSGDRSGFSISLSSDGQRVGIGAPYNDLNGNASGYTRIFEWTQGKWSQLGSSIKGEKEGDCSGAAIALSPSGHRIAIGAPFSTGKAPTAGQVRVFEYINQDWKKLGPNINGEGLNYNLGRSVALSPDGNLLALTSIYDKIMTFQWNGTEWLPHSSPLFPEQLTQLYGFAIRMGKDGKIIAIASYQNRGPKEKNGILKVYEWNPISWEIIGNKLEVMFPENVPANAFALSHDGSSLAIGVASTSPGRKTIRVYRLKEIRDTVDPTHFRDAEVTQTIVDPKLAKHSPFFGEKRELNVFPNPFENSFQIRFFSPHQGRIKLELFSISGRELVYSKSFEDCEKGLQHIHIEGLQLAGGLYLLKLVAPDNQIYSKKIVCSW